MTRYGIVKNARLGYLVCIDHQCVVPADELKDHIASHVGQHSRDLTRAVLDKICEELNVTTTPRKPVEPTDRPVAYAGLFLVAEGRVCPHVVGDGRVCGTGAINMAAMRSHYGKFHKGAVCHDSKVPESPIQRFVPLGQKHSPWFAVSLARRQHQSPTMERILKDAEKAKRDKKSAVPVKDLDPRLVPGWQKLTGWYLKFGDFDKKELLQLIAVPDPSPKRRPEELNNFSQLRPHIDKMYASSIAKLAMTHEMAKCMLNTPEGKGSVPPPSLSPSLPRLTSASILTGRRTTSRLRPFKRERPWRPTRWRCTS